MKSSTVLRARRLRDRALTLAPAWSALLTSLRRYEACPSIPPAPSRRRSWRSPLGSDVLGTGLATSSLSHTWSVERAVSRDVVPLPRDLCRRNDKKPATRPGFDDYKIRATRDSCPGNASANSDVSQ